MCQVLGFTAVNAKGSHDSEMSRANRLNRIKKSGQGERVPRDEMVNGRDSQAVRRRSYRLSLFFIGFPPFRNSRQPACQGSTAGISLINGTNTHGMLMGSMGYEWDMNSQ